MVPPYPTDPHRSQFKVNPPSAKLIYVVLVAEGPLTQSQLADETMLPRRTVRSGLDRLESDGFAELELSIPDIRKTLNRVGIDHGADSASDARLTARLRCRPIRWPEPTRPHGRHRR